MTLEDAIEADLIGGSSDDSIAAKNFRDVAVVASPHNYRGIVREMNQQAGQLSFETRAGLAAGAFALTAKYDAKVVSYLMLSASRGTLPNTVQDAVFNMTGEGKGGDGGQSTLNVLA